MVDDDPGKYAEFSLNSTCSLGDRSTSTTFPITCPRLSSPCSVLLLVYRVVSPCIAFVQRTRADRSSSLTVSSRNIPSLMSILCTRRICSPLVKIVTSRRCSSSTSLRSGPSSLRMRSHILLHQRAGGCCFLSVVGGLTLLFIT